MVNEKGHAAIGFALEKAVCQDSQVVIDNSDLGSRADRGRTRRVIKKNVVGRISFGQ